MDLAIAKRLVSAMLQLFEQDNLILSFVHQSFDSCIPAKYGLSLDLRQDLLGSEVSLVSLSSKPEAVHQHHRLYKHIGARIDQEDRSALLKDGLLCYNDLKADVEELKRVRDVDKAGE